MQIQRVRINELQLLFVPTHLWSCLMWACLNMLVSIALHGLNNDIENSISIPQKLEALVRTVGTSLGNVFSLLNCWIQFFNYNVHENSCKARGYLLRESQEKTNSNESFNIHKLLHLSDTSYEGEKSKLAKTTPRHLDTHLTQYFFLYSRNIVHQTKTFPTIISIFYLEIWQELRTIMLGPQTFVTHSKEEKSI